jgi:pimeloyl-ACP methyl ester carboxylesterase
MTSRRRLLALGIGLAVAALAAAIYVSFALDVQAHRERISRGSELLATRCGPMEYAAAGKGPALLVVHGTGGGFDQGMDFARELGGAGLRVIAPSRFGYLRTPMPADPSAQAQADAFVCLLDALGLDRVAVFGASAGALPALQFVIRHPQRCAALILLVPATYHPGRAQLPPPSRFAEGVLRTIVGSDLPFWVTLRAAPETAIRLVLATPPAEFRAASADEQARARRMLENILPLSARTQGMLNDAREAAAPPRFELEKVRAPSLIFGVRDDLFGTYPAAVYTAETIPGARLVTFERGGHVSLGHNREILDQIAAFVRAASP